MKISNLPDRIQRNSHKEAHQTWKINGETQQEFQQRLRGYKKITSQNNTKYDIKVQ